VLQDIAWPCLPESAPWPNGGIRTSFSLAIGFPSLSRLLLL